MLSFLPILLPAWIAVGCHKGDLHHWASGGTTYVVDSGLPIGVDNDGDLFSDRTDCDDSDPAVNPLSTEVCDGVDDNCDGVLLPYEAIWYLDEDADYYGVGDPVVSCDPTMATQGYSPLLGDCNDDDPAIHPYAVEICDDGIDNDCDGLIDEPIDWYADADGDGVGAGGVALQSCEAPTQSGYSPWSNDCNDSDATISPWAWDACKGDGIDQNCNGEADDSVATYFKDLDADGFGTSDDSIQSCDLVPPDGYTYNSDDCNDGNSAVSPAQPDPCDDFDWNCDGLDCI